jgi:hypothetical protein
MAVSTHAIIDTSCAVVGMEAMVEDSRFPHLLFCFDPLPPLLPRSVISLPISMVSIRTSVLPCDAFSFAVINSAATGIFLVSQR